MREQEAETTDPQLFYFPINDDLAKTAIRLGIEWGMDKSRDGSSRWTAFVVSPNLGTFTEDFKSPSRAANYVEEKLQAAIFDACLKTDNRQQKTEEKRT